MSLSIQKMVSDGTLSTIVLGVQYLQRNDIYMRIDGVETPQSGAPSGYTWSFLDNSTIRVLPVVPTGVEVVVYRRTDIDEMYNIYSQNAQFDESTIDENNQQLLFIAQEYFEQGVAAKGITSVEYVSEDDLNVYYRFVLADGTYTNTFAIPKPADSGGSGGEQVFASVSDVRAATELQVGTKIYLQGYYSDTPGVGGGTLMVTADTTSADNGGTVFVTADGVRLKRERALRLKASDFGARGDWNGTTGTNNKPFIEAMIAASNSSQPWEIDLNNVAVSSIVISSKNNWVGYITGTVINMSAKPVAGASNQKDTAGGALPTFKITSCDGWKIKGGSIDNRYREAFYVQFCSHFTNECDVLGSGLNDNLMPNYYRYCDNFTLKNFRHSGTSAKPATGYYDWCNNLLFWDCSHFKIHNFTVSGTGSNGVYVGSNCNDFTISKFTILENAMSGIQVAWSSFGTFPYRFTITDGVINGNRADGIDINNTIGYASRIDCVISNVLSTDNGYNTDGTVTSDGSGVGTFVWVTHFEVVNCHTIDPARTGFYARSCSDFNLIGGAIKKQKATNNVGGGVHLENCARFNIRDIDVAMYVTQVALKTYGAINTGKIGGTYNGIIQLMPPDATTSYTDVMFLGATLYTANQMTTQFPMYNCKVYSNGNALYAAHNIYGTDVVSVNGSATTIGASRVSITGGTHRGGVNGISSTGYNDIKLDGVKGIADTTGTGIYINGGNKITMLHTHGASTSGTGISTKISNTTTRVTMIGNTYGTGILDVTPSTYTLKDF